MLVPQGTGAESARALEARKEDDLVQKAFGVITQKEAQAEQPEDPQVDLLTCAGSLASCSSEGPLHRIGPNERLCLMTARHTHTQIISAGQSSRQMGLYIRDGLSEAGCDTLCRMGQISFL